MDEDKLELLGKQETLEREKQELLESNRIAQEKFGKMEAVLDEIKAAREKSEKELGLLQNALKAVEMQKTQLLASNQNLHGQLEEVNSQVSFCQFEVMCYHRLTTSTQYLWFDVFSHVRSLMC